MFTGIVENCATLKSLKKEGSNLVLELQSDLDAEHFVRGNSIAVDGVCMTMELFDVSEKIFTVTVVPETLEKTHFSNLKLGQRFNVEAPITMKTPVAGHFVLGHVDGVANVVQAGEDFRLQLPPEFLRFCPQKGSIALNGVSLTIAECLDDQIRIALIPETLKRTNLSDLNPGDLINFEVDMLARYLDQLSKSFV